MVDIARTAQVSRTSVSLILNQVPGVRIAEATRQRVLQVARDLGYRPGPLLSDLGPERKRIIGVLINEISSAYPVDLIYGLQNQADAQGVQIIIHVSDGVVDREMVALENFERFGVAGVVYASTFSAIASPPAQLEKFRHVMLNCRRKDHSGFAVLPAERHGGALAAQHLIEIGRSRIATITGDPWQFASKERLAGFRRTLSKAGLDLNATLHRSSDWGHASGYLATLKLLDLPQPPDAIFCHNDIIARGAIQAAHERKWRVPDDLAIIGYDDREFAKDLGITSVSLPFLEMAESALTELIGEDRLKPQTLLVSGTLICRSSTVKHS